MAKKYTYEMVAAFFERAGCKLLTTEYIRSTQKLRYKCSCGNVAVTEFRNFVSGKRCKRCGTRKMMETIKSKHGGKFLFQTKEFLENRKKVWRRKYGVDSPLKSQVIKRKRRKTNMSRYGVPEVSQAPEVRERQKQGLVRTYGVKYCMQSKQIREKFSKTLMRKYGVPKLAYLSRRASKQSQRLFWSLYRMLPPVLRKKSYFAELNQEFVVSSRREYFRFDYVNSKAKKAIEFNGVRFHPLSSQSPEETGWCVFHPSLSVSEARAKEERKYGALRSRGFEILTIWDTEYRKDPKVTVMKCFSFLTQGSP